MGAAVTLRVPVLVSADSVGHGCLAKGLTSTYPFSRLLSYGAPLGQSSLVFASVFTLVWCGAGIVALNAKLLGGTM